MATDFVEFHQHASSDKAVGGEGDCARSVALTNSLTESLEPLWTQCENVLVQCLDEYLNFAGKRELFSSPLEEAHDNNNDDKNNNSEVEEILDESVWIEDLSGLESVLRATENFLSYKSWLLDRAKTTSLVSMLESGGSESELFRCLSKLCQAHLRLVHNETMDCMDGLLSQESWDLIGLKNVDGSNLEDGVGFEALQKALESRLNNYEKLMAAMNTSQPEVAGGLQRSFDEWSGILHTGKMATRSLQSQFLDSVNSNNLDQAIREDPISIGEGLLSWVSRLILIADKLPLVASEIGEVVKDTFDLCITTVLRLCSGNVKNERVLIGLDRPNPIRAILEDDRRNPVPIGKRPSSPAIFFGKDRKRGKSARPQIVHPALREVDICSPLLKDETEVSRLRKFAIRAQENLQDTVDLDSVDAWLADPEGPMVAMPCARMLEWKIAAAWSCFAVASLGDVCYLLASSRLSKRHGSAVEKKLQSLESYVQSLALVVATLVEFSVLFSCVKAINGQGIVSRIISVGAVWEECKLHEHSNDYVEDLCDRCAQVWGDLVCSGKLPMKVTEYCLQKLVFVGYQCMLEGFSRVRFCSTEGRALMALDLASFSAGLRGDAFTQRLENTKPRTTIPPILLSGGMKRVDTYIKVFYYPQDEVVNWVKDNFRDYKMNQTMALVANFDFSASEEKLQDILEDIKTLYQSEEQKEG